MMAIILLSKGLVLLLVLLKCQTRPRPGKEKEGKDEKDEKEEKEEKEGKDEKEEEEPNREMPLLVLG